MLYNAYMHQNNLVMRVHPTVKQHIRMKVFKFGGASVKDANGVKNVCGIISGTPENLVVVVSAMGKTTNAFERILNAYLDDKQEILRAEVKALKKYHEEIISNLFENPAQPLFEMEATFEGLLYFLSINTKRDYDFCYDQVVSVGELISTKIVASYLATQNVNAEWIDVRTILRTDSTYRDANVDFDKSAELFKNQIDFSKTQVYLTQGFIGANHKGFSTTLGREGSDYTAAIIANLLNGESVTIWKDVPGVLNADPRIFNETVHLPSVSYKQAIELAFFGAQIIHPKTIKPLQNKGIPLYVKSFVEPSAVGTEVAASISKIDAVPVYILKQQQVLISVEPKDYSFALEDSWIKLFTIMQKHRLKTNLVQNSAISISICVDGNNHYLNDALEEMMNSFRVKYNENLSLLTIQNYNEQILENYSCNKEVLLMQKSRRTARILYK